MRESKGALRGFMLVPWPLKLVLPGVVRFVVEIKGRFGYVCARFLLFVCLCDNVLHCLDRLNEGQLEASRQCIIKWVRFAAWLPDSGN